MLSTISRLIILCGVFLSAVDGIRAEVNHSSTPLAKTAQYRGPVDLIVADDESWLVTINELSSTLSLVELGTGKIVDELAVGKKPSGIAKISSDELLISCREAGVVQRIRVETNRLVMDATIPVGFEPLGLAADSRRAFVGLQATGEVAEIDLDTNTLRRRFSVGRWPRYLTLSPDGSRLAVGLSGDSSIAIVDANAGEVLYDEPLSGGINIGHMRCSSDGKQVYFPWMIYRSNPIDVRNIQRGWVLASRVARVRLDGPAYREAISLDVPRLAVADPYGIALSPNEHRLSISSAGTHELLVYRLGDLPFVAAGGPGDLIDQRLLRDADLFYRIELGGRPTGIVASRDNTTVFVANQTSDSVQLVDIETRQVTQTISLGPLPSDTDAQLAHRGMEIFYDARRSLDQWYSCNSCHLDGGSNAKTMDTWNDGTQLTNKAVLPLMGVSETGPWTWHGWQEDLDESIQNSFVSTMQGKEATDEDLRALRAYLVSLKYPSNPFLSADSGSSPVAERGAELFRKSEFGCADCHSGPHFTDGQIHDVGMSRETDKYQGYNTPSLLGVHRKVRWLHDGRAKSLEEVLTKWHSPEEVGGGGKLSKSQLAELVEYLRSL